jgi:hypothetical protein
MSGIFKMPQSSKLYPTKMVMLTSAPGRNEGHAETIHQEKTYITLLNRETLTLEIINNCELFTLFVIVYAI